MATDVAAVLDSVGARLRALRQQRGSTLAGLSQATGISVSTLSRLESGGRRPTLDLLLPISLAYQVSLDELVGAPGGQHPRVRPDPIVRDGMTYLPLTRRPGRLRAFKLVIAPGLPGGEPAPQTHQGYEWLYVLSGRLRLVLGERDLLLTTGEVAEFDTRLPHWLANPGLEPVEILTLFGPQGERLHVRARPKRGESGPTPGRSGSRELSWPDGAGEPD